MNGKNIGLLILGAVLGLLVGAGGLYYAQSSGLLSEWRGAAERHGPEEHDRASYESEAHSDEHEGDEPAHADEGHGDHGHEEENGGVRLTPEAVKEHGIEIAEASGGEFQQTIALPGEVVLNPDKLAHIVPRVGGIVREVDKTVGDMVEAGELLAVLESRELAEAKAAYLAGKQRMELAQANLAANEELMTKGIVPDLEFLAAKRDLAETEIKLRAAEFKLHTLGVTQQEVAGIEQQSDDEFPYHELRAPFAGAVIARHITSGEVVTTETAVFEIADLRDVWVNLTVYQKDLDRVRTGQPVSIIAGHNIGQASGTISFVSPVIDEATRTAVARVVLENPEGRWRPGLFVNGLIETGTVTATVVVPQSAVIGVEEQLVVFVLTGGEFRPRPVRTGRTTEQEVEVVGGLRPGESYAATGVLTLKAQLNSAALEHAGHAH
jgi:cobalt-zinc-cadmium efflux system membrane fusion protein